MSRKLVHYRDIRLAVNAGVSAPVCAPNDGTRWYDTTSVAKDVTCRRCPAAHAAAYSWAGAKGFTHPAQEPARRGSRASAGTAQPATHSEDRGPQGSLG